MLFRSVRAVPDRRRHRRQHADRAAAEEAAEGKEAANGWWTWWDKKCVVLELLFVFLALLAYAIGCGLILQHNK